MIIFLIVRKYIKPESITFLFYSIDQIILNFCLSTHDLAKSKLLGITTHKFMVE